MPERIEGTLEGRDLRFGVVVSRFNDMVTRRLLEGALDALRRHGVSDEAIEVVWVPGSWELPQAAARLVARGGCDGLVVLGALIRGETAHFEVLAHAVAGALMRVAEGARIPVAFGVLTADTLQQALDRAGGKAGNKGWEAALGALEMAQLFRRLG